MVNGAATRVVITKVPFGGFIRFAACFGFSAGLVLGFAALIASPFGIIDSHVTERWGGYSFSGVLAGVLFFCASPMYFTVVVTVIAVPAYVPFRYLSRILRRYKMPADCVVPVAPLDDGKAEAIMSVQPHVKPSAESGPG